MSKKRLCPACEEGIAYICTCRKKEPAVSEGGHVIRIICRSTDDTAMVHTGAPLDVEWKTFDVSIPELERWLAGVKGREYRSVAGVELLHDQPKEAA